MTAQNSVDFVVTIDITINLLYTQDVTNKVTTKNSDIGGNGE